jgi:hypothetical protein
MHGPTTRSSVYGGAEGPMMQEGVGLWDWKVTLLGGRVQLDVVGLALLVSWGAQKSRMPALPPGCSGELAQAHVCGTSPQPEEPV